MLPNIPYRYMRILPINYDDYISHTELLNDLIDRFNAAVNNINNLEQDIEHLRQYLDDLHVDQLRADITNLRLSVTDIEDAINSMLSDIHDNTDQIEYLNNMTDSLQEQIPLVYDHIARIANNFSEVIKSVDLNGKIRLDSFKVYVRHRLTDIRFDFAKAMDDLVDNLSKIVIMVTNPWTGNRQSLQSVLYYMAHRMDGATTCYTYDHAGLTCQDYDDLHLTCQEYDIFGLPHRVLCRNQQQQPIADLYGRVRSNPLSSVYQVGGKAMTCQEYDNLGLRCSDYPHIKTFLYDQYGLLAVRNISKGVRCSIPVGGSIQIYERTNDAGLEYYQYRQYLDNLLPDNPMLSLPDSYQINVSVMVTPNPMCASSSLVIYTIDKTVTRVAGGTGSQDHLMLIIDFCVSGNVLDTDNNSMDFTVQYDGTVDIMEDYQRLQVNDI